MSLSCVCVCACAPLQVGYNRACGLVETGQWSAAETELKMAIKLGG
jgi:hypothetical protein